ncbi:MAG: magnesium ion transporter [Chrysothrix sp. TS-e1954]|nr:MAG: magnesium ion transporter [Chrysothrix sp. TS-e1954]
MKQVPIYNATAPSKTLLKFLRAQRDGQPFFSSNNAVKHGFRCGSPAFHTKQTHITHPSKRSMTTDASPFQSTDSSIQTLESSLFSLLPPRNRTTSSLSHPNDLRPPAFYTNTPLAYFHATSHAQKDDRQRDHPKSNKSLFRFRRQKPESAELPALPSFLDEQASISHGIVRGPNDHKLRCTEFDDVGNITLTNSEFKKTELIAKYGLLPRDLRKIDSSLLPNILIRPSAILINLLHLRVLIKHDKVLVFDAYGSTDSYTQTLFMDDLEYKLRAPETRTPGSSTVGAQLPYEFRAIEAILISVTNGLESEFEGVREPVVRVLRELEEDIDRDKLRHLLIYSKKLSSFEQKARLVRDAIDDLLEADDDLAAMYLTEKAKGALRENDDHTEVEMLLENYHKVTDEIVQVSGNLVSNIRNTEEIVKAILDANRNSLMLLDLKFSIGTLGLGGGTFFAALYGMNLKNFIEENDFGFWGVSGGCAVVSAVVCMWGLKRLRKVQRVSMFGQERGDPTRGRSGWALAAKQGQQQLPAGQKDKNHRDKDNKQLGASYGNEEPSSHAMAPAKDLRTTQVVV